MLGGRENSPSLASSSSLSSLTSITLRFLLVLAAACFALRGVAELEEEAAAAGLLVSGVGSAAAAAAGAGSLLSASMRGTASRSALSSTGCSQGS